MLIPGYVQNLNDYFASLPGIGMKTAARLAFHTLTSDQYKLNSIIDLYQKIQNELNFCQLCTFFAEEGENLCAICDNPQRENNQIIIVENKIDVIAIEDLNFYKGKYHILNGLISPLKNILPENLNISALKDRLLQLSQEIEHIEVVLAIDTNIEGEATVAYLTKYITDLLITNIKLSILARGLPTGADLDYTDKDTLHNSFLYRNPIN